MNTWMQVFSETRNTGLSAGEDGVILRVVVWLTDTHTHRCAMMNTALCVL